MSRAETKRKSCDTEGTQQTEERAVTPGRENSPYKTRKSERIWHLLDATSKSVMAGS